jgi:heme A synthase
MSDWRTKYVTPRSVLGLIFGVLAVILTLLLWQGEIEADLNLVKDVWWVILIILIVLAALL